MQETLVQSLGQEDPLEKGTATHSSILGLFWSFIQQRIHLLFRRPGFSSWIGKIPGRGDWQSTAVFLAGGFHGQKSLAGYSLWGCKELDTTERLSLRCHSIQWSSVCLPMLRSISNTFSFSLLIVFSFPAPF